MSHIVECGRCGWTAPRPPASPPRPGSLPGSGPPPIAARIGHDWPGGGAAVVLSPPPPPSPPPPMSAEPANTLQKYVDPGSSSKTPLHETQHCCRARKSQGIACAVVPCPQHTHVSNTSTSSSIARSDVGAPNASGKAHCLHCCISPLSYLSNLRTGACSRQFG